MDALSVIISSIVSCIMYTEAVPPEACFANFRWEDCGQPPIPVMYYWKPGSRCEVGIWRGCLPSLNMFKSEYECVSTCIFTVTPRPENWHEINKEDDLEYDSKESTTEGDTTFDGTTDMTESGSGSEIGSGDETPASQTEGASESENEASDAATKDPGVTDKDAESTTGGEPKGESTNQVTEASDIVETTPPAE